MSTPNLALWWFDEYAGELVRAADGARFRPEQCPWQTDEEITAWVMVQPAQPTRATE